MLDSATLTSVARSPNCPGGYPRPVALGGWLLLMAGLIGLAGCSGLDPVAPYKEPITDPTQLYTRLTLDYRALTLSTATGYDTWQLTATSRNAVGEPMTSLPAPTFRPLNAGDTATVRVTADGKLTALQVGTTKILAELVAPGNIRHADTAFIKVTDLASPPTLASVSIDPLPPDSAIRPMPYIAPLNADRFNAAPPSGVGSAIAALGVSLSFGYPLTPRVLSTLGESVTQLPVEYESLDPTIATIIKLTSNSPPIWVPLNPGQARIVVRTTAYGVTVVDTTVFTATLPVFVDVLAKPQLGAPTTTIFGPSEVHIRPNGVVYWFNLLDHPVDVVFDDPTNVMPAPARVCNPGFGLAIRSFLNCSEAGDFTLQPLVLPPGGNLQREGSKTGHFRQFPVPGTYLYHSTLTGAVGRVVVE